MEDIMENSTLPELVGLMTDCVGAADFAERISDYHEGDIAAALTELTPEERGRVCAALPVSYLSEIFAYLEDAAEYLKELPRKTAIDIVSGMDSDDAVDILEGLDREAAEAVVAELDPESSEDIRLILSYDDDEIGSKMTTNYVVIPNTFSVKQAMKSLVEQAGENDNISILYVTDEQDRFYGSIRLKDLIVAREQTPLGDLIYLSGPYLYAREKVADCLERIKGYAEDSLPVLNEEDRLIGIITASDVVEVVDEELGEDYAKLAGLTAEEDLKEKLFTSMRKRLPWLIVLLFLGIGVSGVVGVFEGVVASLPIIICFQSLILDMAGNVGTQSLAVTIRVLTDGELKASQKLRLAFKEMKVGLCNGLFLGVLSFVFIGLYVWLLKGQAPGHAFLISACVGAALMAAMLISSIIGTVVPMFFHKIHVDPAVASGPLITTVNDLVAVITYYGLAWLLLIEVLHIV